MQDKIFLEGETGWETYFEKSESCADCEFSEISLYEHDTGCMEVECELTGGQCYEECCPLCATYIVRKGS